jgi:hypothetical protein
MPGFYNDDERAAWTIAEQLMEKGRAVMRQAEKALDAFKIGMELNRRRCARRGIGPSDAEIRWTETADAKKALSENSFNVNQALMYYGAAAAHYSRAAYLRTCATDRERRSDRGGSRSGAVLPYGANRT